MCKLFFNLKKKVKTVNFLLFIPDCLICKKKRIDDVNENNAPIVYICTQESISESCLIRPNLDFNYPYPSVLYQMKFRLVPNHSEKCNSNVVQKQNHRT